MKKITLTLFFAIVAFTISYAQTEEPVVVSTKVNAKKHLSSSILLWMRTDQARQIGMDRWKGPHAQIIAANKGLLEYRQIHFADVNPGLWLAINGVETAIPQDRKVDGVADVTLKNYFSLFKGKKQNEMASADEVNLFKRTLLYAAFPKNSFWYEVANANTKVGASSMVFFKKKQGISEKDFAKFINEELTPALANSGMLIELRNKVYNPWKQKQWDTPNVLHDNVEADQFQASLILGFTDKLEMQKFFASQELKSLSNRISIFCSAVHAYDISEVITFVKDGKKIN